MTTDAPQYGAVFGAEAAGDPYESYERMRREAPVSRVVAMAEFGL